jgi:hypothetical protein
MVCMDFALKIVAMKVRLAVMVWFTPNTTRCAMMVTPTQIRGPIAVDSPAN